MGKPHKHAALIKKWADGKEIQYYNNVWARWVDVTDPMWDEDVTYRIKPTKVTWWLRIYEDCDGSFHVMRRLTPDGFPDREYITDVILVELDVEE